MRPVGLFLALSFAVAIVLLSGSCFDFDRAYTDCIQDGGNCAPVDRGDGGSSDGGDGGRVDSGTPDAGPPDGGMGDAGTPDAGTCRNGLCHVRTYSTSSRDALLAIWGPAHDDVWFAGQNERFVHWNGTQFDQDSLRGYMDYNVYELAGTSGTDIWAGGGEGLLLHFDGTDWVTQNPTAYDYFWGLWSLAPGKVLVSSTGVDFYPELLTWEVGTLQGQTVIDNDQVSYHNMWGAPSGKIWIVGAEEANEIAAILERLPDGGLSGPTLYPPAQGLYSVHGTSDENIWAGGSNGTVFHRSDAGWSRVTSPGGGHIFWDTWVAPNGEVYFVSYSPTIFRREVDGGWSTFILPEAAGHDITEVYGFPNGDIWFTGTDYDNTSRNYDGGIILQYRRQ